MTSSSVGVGVVTSATSAGSVFSDSSRGDLAIASRAVLLGLSGGATAPSCIRIDDKTDGSPAVYVNVPLYVTSELFVDGASVSGNNNTLAAVTYDATARSVWISGNLSVAGSVSAADGFGVFRAGARPPAASGDGGMFTYDASTDTVHVAGNLVVTGEVSAVGLGLGAGEGTGVDTGVGTGVGSGTGTAGTGTAGTSASPTLTVTNATTDRTATFGIASAAGDLCVGSAADDAVLVASDPGASVRLSAGGGSPQLTVSVGSVTVDGTVYATGDVVAFSDAKLKSDVRVISGALDRVRAIRGCTFVNGVDGRRSTGVIAQDVRSALPEAVRSVVDRDGNETLAVAYGNLVGLLIEAIKDLEDKVDALTAARGA